MNIDLVEGDTGSKLVITCVDNDTEEAIDITGAALSLKYRIEGGTLETKGLAITNALSGIAEYQFKTGELTKGEMLGSVEITSVSTLISSVFTFSLIVRGGTVTQLSKNLSMAEMIHTDTGLKNTPTKAYGYKFFIMAQMLFQPIRNQFGPIKVTSGYRNRFVNKRVGGWKNSQHESRGDGCQTDQSGHHAGS